MSPVSSAALALQQAFSSIHHRFAWYEGGFLFDFLQRHLPAERLLLPDFDWTERAGFGGLYVNGIPARADQSLPLPALVEYFEPKFDLRRAHEFYPEFNPDWIVFEDEILLVVFKPARLPTMPAKEQSRFSLRKYLDTYVGAEVHCPSRLDMSTQGLVIVSKQRESHGIIQQLFEKKLVQKEYLFLTNTSDGKEWQTKLVDQPIGKTDLHPVLRAVHGKNSKAAQTFFVRANQHLFTDALGQEHAGCYYIARPQTGRTHQIRVHSQFLGISIAGDRFYSGVPFSPLALLSLNVSFNHPHTLKPLHIQVPERLIPEWAAGARVSGGSFR